HVLESLDFCRGAKLNIYKLRRNKLLALIWITQRPKKRSWTRCGFEATGPAAGAPAAPCCGAMMLRCRRGRPLARCMPRPAWAISRLLSAFFRLLACTGLLCRSERRSSHERSQTFDAQGHGRLAGGKYVPIV